MSHWDNGSTQLSKLSKITPSKSRGGSLFRQVVHHRAHSPGSHYKASQWTLPPVLEMAISHTWITVVGAWICSHFIWMYTLIVLKVMSADLCTCMWVPVEARELGSLWNWSYRPLWTAQLGYWEQNLNAAEEWWEPWNGFFIFQIVSLHKLRLSLNSEFTCLSFQSARI